MKTLRLKIEYFGLRLGVGLVELLPYRLLRPLANFLGWLVFHLDARGRGTALENLRVAFGDEMTEARRREVARKSFQTFARTMLELFWSPNLRKEHLDRYAVVEGLERDPCHFNQDQAAVYVCLHFSNFEWLGHVCAFLITPGFVISQRFKNPALGPIFDRARAASGHEVLKSERAFIRMFKHLKAGGKFGMLGDLTVDPREPSVIVNCFGLKTCMTQLHAGLALRTNAKIVPLECFPIADGRYRVVFHRPIENTEGKSAGELAQLCWDALEPSIRKNPELWLWTYKHWRFKPEGVEGARYPAYANPNKRFERKLVEAATSSPDGSTSRP